MSNLNTKKMFEKAQILHMKIVTQIVFESSNSGRIIPRNNQIIHINRNIELHKTLSKSAKGTIRVGLQKAILFKRRGQLSKPTTRSLMKTIKRLLKPTQQTKCMTLKIWRMFHIQFLIEITMEESIMNIHLMQFPIFSCSNSQ